MNIGENIRRIRMEKHMTQKELGEKLGGISQQQIGQWETGKANPKIDTIQKIADALNVSVIDFIENIYQIRKGPHGIGPILSNATLKVSKMDEVFLMNFYRQLNDAGKTEAYKRVGELTLIETYKTTETQSPIIKYNPDAIQDISELSTYTNIPDTPPQS